MIFQFIINWPLHGDKISSRLSFSFSFSPIVFPGIIVCALIDMKHFCPRAGKETRHCVQKVGKNKRLVRNKTMFLSVSCPQFGKTWVQKLGQKGLCFLQLRAKKPEVLKRDTIRHCENQQTSTALADSRRNVRKVR